MKPNFFIVGTPKAGTTSLYHYLEEHPEIYVSPIKETNHFSYNEIKSQGLYYNEEYVRTAADYDAQFAGVNKEKAIGEASVSYLFYPEVVQRIHAFNPNAKIIIVLRNPISRGFSHYLMDSRLGFTGNLTFEDIVFKQKKHKNLYLYYQQFVELGFYYEQVKRYIDLFGKEQVQIFLLEDLKADINQVVTNIYDFLSVDKAFSPDLATNHNPFLAPRNKIIGNLYKQKWIRTLLTRLIPRQLIEDIKNKLFSKSFKPTVNTKTKAYLTDLYRSDILQLEVLIQRDLKSWYEV